MSVRVLIKDHPHRTIALATEDHVLVFRHSASSTASGSTSSLRLPNAAAAPRCLVEFSPRASVDVSEFRTAGGGQGTLGLITLNNDVFLTVIQSSSHVATVRPGETVQRIHAVEFYCLNRTEYDHSHDHDHDPNPYPGQGFASDEVDYEDAAGEHPFSALKKLLSAGYFYYSVDFDLTSRLQDRSRENATVDIESLDEGLLWNSYMIGPLLQFRSRLSDTERDELDQSKILTSVIRGFVKTLTIPPSSAPLRKVSSSLPSSLTVISRLSSRRAGTRFNARGIDDDGNVANFVETETIFWSPSGICFSYTQVRGSVPIFWESSSSLIPGQQKIQITRSLEATQPAFDKHFDQLELRYGAVHVINLLSVAKPGEAEISQRYRHHLQRRAHQRDGDQDAASEHQLLRETEFDFHAETKGAGGYEGAKMIRPRLQSSIDGFAYFMADQVHDDARVEDMDTEKHAIDRSVPVLQQEGVFRTNCLDCLDRTNLIQSLISQMAFEEFLSHRGERASADFWVRHSSLWADNGDHLSKIYAGTGALKSSFTRHGKMSLAGAIADARKSATRLYVNNFADKGRQNTIDLLLGRLMGQTPVHLFDPINDFVTAELARRAPEYSSTKPIHLWVGTFNLNGRTNGLNEDLTPWLCPHTESHLEDPEIVAVGFQEIVELSPQQIMSTDPTRRHSWEDAVKRALNQDAKKRRSGDYVLLRSGQLVGAALLIFVKAHVLSEIKNVEGSIKKTGLSGIAGNKGAVAIRLDFANTSMCFVTAHLAAGFANYEERNRDFRTISHGLRFQKNRSIEDHDTIIWLGDFNYRIGLSDEKARKLVEARDLERLYENDQLNVQMVHGLTFPFYSEARITFLPTYKYNVGTDEYDTSEKARIPAWCDRVLRKGTNLRQIDYNTAPLRCSDHRPVYATFECHVTILDQPLKDRLSHEIYERRRLDISHTTSSSSTALSPTATNDISDDEDDLLGYDSIAPGLPPASSDRRKWWLDNGLPARSSIKPPVDGLVPNTQRPANPWAPTSEPDWVEVNRPSSTEGAMRRFQNSNTTKPEPPTPRRQRMVPPAWEGERKVPSGTAKSREEQEGTPPPMPARRASTVSTATTSSSTASASRKPAPPKPKKPPTLTSSPTNSSTNPLPTIASSTTSTPLATSHPPNPETNPTLPSRDRSISIPRSSTPSSASVLQKAPPPAVQPRQSRRLQRNDSSQSTSRAASSAAATDPETSNDNDAPGPPLPPRRAANAKHTNAARASSASDGLMDEHDEAEYRLAGWKPLQPR